MTNLWLTEHDQKCHVAASRSPFYKTAGSWTSLPFSPSCSGSMDMMIEALANTLVVEMTE